MMHFGKTIPSFCKMGGAAFRGIVTKQVMVSQSENKFANQALEDWVCRNIDLSTKNILILSRNKGGSVVSPTITATFIGKDLDSKERYQESLVYSSLPASLPLASLPRPVGQMEGGCLSLSVQLELAEDVDDKAVMTALQNIGQNFMSHDNMVGSPSTPRMSLVRPDDGWFPGIGQIQSDLEAVVQQVGLRKKRETIKKKRERSGHAEYQLADSFGSL